MMKPQPNRRRSPKCPRPGLAPAFGAACARPSPTHRGRPCGHGQPRDLPWSRRPCRGWVRPRPPARRRDGAGGASALLKPGPLGALNPPGTAGAAAGAPAAAVGAEGADGVRVRGTARPTTRVCVINGAQAAQTSFRVHTWAMAGSWRSTSSTLPMQCTGLPSWEAHCVCRQAQAASACTVAARACAPTWASAKRRSAARSRDRGGMAQGEEHVTDAVRSLWPEMRTVHVRPGRRAAGDSECGRSKTGSPSAVGCSR